MHESPFMKVDEVARELGVTPAHVYRLVSDGVVPATRVNRRIVIPRNAWHTWIAGRTEAALASLRDAVNNS